MKGVEPLPFSLRNGRLGDELRVQGLPLCVVREPYLSSPRARTAERVSEFDVIDLLALPVIEDYRVARIERRQDSSRPQNSKSERVHRRDVDAGRPCSVWLTRAERGNSRSEFRTRRTRERDDEYLVRGCTVVEDVSNAPLYRRALSSTWSGDQPYLRRGVLGSPPLLLLCLCYLRWVNRHGLFRCGSSSVPPPRLVGQAID